MSFRGGRGGGNNGFQRNLPFGLDYQDVTKLTESEKPSIILPVNGSMADEEKIISSHFINFKTNVRDGPFYTGDSLEVNKSKKHEIHEDGLNDGLKRYSDRYLKKRSIGHSIDDHPYSIEFFPQELYRVMGVDDQKKKKLLQLSKLRSSKQVLESLNNDEIGNTILEKLKEMADVDDEKDDERDEIEENLDDEFEEEDDDDYNAEKYFDDGEDFGDEDDYNDEAAF
jgi:DNA-directed RNA polymerase III subunit RPC7